MKKSIIIFLLIPITIFSQNKELKRTKICPNINGEISADTNIVYCASFQIAWNNLKDSVIGEKIKLKNPPDFIDFINNYDTKNIIDSNYLFVKSGFAKDDILTKINKELIQRFGKEINLPYSLNKTDIITFAYLKKNIQFLIPIYDYFGLKHSLIFNKKEVKFFGLKLGKSTGQCLHDYKNDNDFIYQIFSKDSLDEIYFAKVNPLISLDKTYESVIERINKKNISYLTYSDQVKIPYIDLNIIQRFDDLEKKQFINKDFKTYFLTEAIQMIDFNLNEWGITLESYGYLWESEGLSFPEKNIVFNKPFLIILKQKDSNEPYFLMWVANTELMKKI